MIRRALRTVLDDRLARHPAVVLVGPRQAGKTTLARELGGDYFDLEQAGDRTRLDVEWDRVCAQRGLVILDEAQSWPELFARLRGAIDADRKRNGRFLLLGSVSPALMQHVSDSLAGRLALLELTPFLLWEVPDASVAERWLRGGYPDGGILDAARFPEWQESYLTLLAQRDLPTWGLPARPQTIDRLLRMTAAVHGQTLNLSRLGQSLGLTHPTVRTYLDHLEGAFLVRRLEPYLANVQKRLVRSPKLYWRDSGLLHTLLRIGTYDDLLVQPWAGASWEGFVIEQVIGTLALSQSLERHRDGRIFHGPRNGILKPDTVRNILVRDVIEPLMVRFPTPTGEIGFEHGRIHSFRHYFCSQAFLSGAAAADIQEWLGHRDSKMVAHYRHLRPEDGRRKNGRIGFLGRDDRS